MQLEINRMIESDNNFIKRLGWFLYDQKNIEKGISANGVKELLNIFNQFNVSREEDRMCKKAYDQGYRDAEEEYSGREY